MSDLARDLRRRVQLMEAVLDAADAETFAEERIRELEEQGTATFREMAAAHGDLEACQERRAAAVREWRA